MDNKLILNTSVLIGFIFLSMAYISACGYQDHSSCEIGKTFIEGKIYYADTNQSAGGATVTITCFHNGGQYTKTTTSLSNGFLKGTYFVQFPHTQCITGDIVEVSATKGDKNGEDDGVVKDFITGRCLDIDIAIINVPLVPEFGVVVGFLTMISAIGVFFVIRKK